MRAPSPNDFVIPVEGVGTFVFARRQMKDHIKINVLYSEMIEGVQPTAWLDVVCTWIATLKVLAVRVPEGFDIDSLDPLDDDTYARLLKVNEALRLTEESFRQKPKAGGQGGGQAGSGDAGVLVSPKVQPDAHRPALP